MEYPPLDLMNWPLRKGQVRLTIQYPAAEFGKEPRPDV